MVGTLSRARSGVARLEAGFRLLPMAAHACRADIAFVRVYAFMDMPRRIARERVPTMGIDLMRASGESAKQT